MAKKSKKKTAQETEVTDATIEETVAEVAEEEAAPETEEIVEEELDPMAALQLEVDEANATAAKNWDMYLRERAEMENFRKRAQRDKEDAIRYANDRLLRETIPVLDNLERAVEHAGQNGDESQGLVEGVNMTISMFQKVLEDFGVKPIAASGEAFDPNVHQAMGQLETDEFPPNCVAVELQKGYLLNERLLRPSMVMVAKAPTAGEPEEGSADQENENEDDA